MMPLARRAAKSYIAGPELPDALRVCRQLSQQGFSTTTGFWDGPDDSPESVADEYVSALNALAQENSDSYLSIKLPALDNSSELLNLVVEHGRRAASEAGSDVAEFVRILGVTASGGPTSHEVGYGHAGATALAEVSSSRGIRIHFDSLGADSANAMWTAAVDAATEGATISCSLPGRWRRSLADADDAVAAGIIPRVVKGQWPDPDAPQIDLRSGFMSVVERLAGRVPHVAVATHDVPLARQAVQCLRAAGTSCELELLFGLPQRASLAFAESEGVHVRFYVPYGKAYLPYCLGQIGRQPRLLWWLMRDALVQRA
ncbi:MAG: hypothetical protein ACREHD_24185 [Pirellulales bacterium]